MDKPFHVIEEKYYACEPGTFGSGQWKTYDETAFETIMDSIGRSTTGKVHLMMHKKSGYLGVMKVVHCRRGSAVQTELDTLRIARDNPFLVRLIDGFLSSVESQGGSETSNHYIFLEYAPFKSLDHLTQAVKGVGSIKARDVKPENVFIRMSGHVALGDFGLAIDATSDCTNICGTFLTRPPEVWAAENYSYPVDVWMYGISLYNIISNKWPFMAPSKDRQIQRVKAAKMTFDIKFCEVSIDLITKLVQSHPRARLRVKEIVKHKYFQDLHPQIDLPFTQQNLLDIYKFEAQEEYVVTKLVSQQ